MAQKNKASLDNDFSNKSGMSELRDIVDSVQLLTPGTNTLPTSDPAEAGSLFITGSAGAFLGAITGSGFALLCVSQG
tara:strand:+ start:95 stop:325 length:231 start_codon:yes stop_codon:yes gene_type:complete